MYVIGLLVVLTVVESRPQISLEYKPMRPFYHPRPSGTHPSQIVPSGQPWPDNANANQNFNQVPTIADRTKETQSENKETSLSGSSSGFLWPETEDSEEEITKPPTQTSTTTRKITLEYQPTRPPHHPKPGNNLQPIVPPSKPWPAGPDGYLTTLAPTIVDRIKEDSLQTSTPTSQTQTPINLGYKPTRPFYHPNPGNHINQIVPPGQPWPSSPEGYQNFSQVGNSPNLVNRIQETSSTSTTTKSPQETISLEYQPNRPSFHPNPGNNINQIVPPGQPWPSSAEGYQNFSQTGNSPDLVNKIKDTTVPSTVATAKPQEQTISLEYQPNRPSFHPNPGNNINQIIPPGKPWPGNPQGYQNFSQTGNSPNVVNRGQETNSSSAEQSSTQSTSSSQLPQKPPISLEYQPNPPFHARPGSTLSQIVPPGEPWPNNPEGYQNFSQMAPALNVQERVKESPESSTTIQVPSAVPTQTPISLESKPSTPGNTLAQVVPLGQLRPGSSEGDQNIAQSTQLPDLLTRLKDFVDKKNAKDKGTKPEETVIVEEMESKSDGNLTESGQSKPEIINGTEQPTESSVSELMSSETSTTNAAATTVRNIHPEGKLYTSAPVKETNEQKLS
ncbi:hypothetical protein Zmor_023340 [Zophobas morio]|uniref:Uncharacterized protein n=1 Tax=Zophobas morio TaxID=2755281 RepID=A0AA38HWW8_9CUCU|nr:hypothetical protein Zmor_023340 [Zophobas morio]